MSVFYPDEWLESTFLIPFDEYYKKGYKGVMFDIDNTLVPHNAPADQRARDFFAGLKEMGFETCVISNNKEPRVKSFAEAVACHYVHKANKPLPGGYRKGLSLMGTNENNTIFVGDQIFTDVMGARWAGIHTILVNPIHPKEEIQIILKRIPEKLVLYCYKRMIAGKAQQKNY